MSFFENWAKLFSAIFIFVASLGGVLCAFCRFNSFTYFYGESLYVGIFVSVAFFHFLPESFSKDDTSYNRSSLVLSVCFLFFLIIELISRHFSNVLRSPTNLIDVQNDVSTTSSQMQNILIPYLENNGRPITIQESILMASRLFFNSILIGLAMGITKNDDTIFTMVLAVALSKFLEAIALGTRLLGRTSKPLFWILTILYSCITPGFTLFFNHFLCCKNDTIISICDAVSGALFIYIGFQHWQKLFFSPYEYSKTELICMTFLFLIGITIVSIAAINWANHLND